MPKESESGTGLQAKIMRYMEQRPGVNVYLDEMRHEFGVPEALVQTAVRNIRQRDYWREAVEVVVRGRVWMYRPNRKPVEDERKDTPLCFEEVGQTRDGDLILQCEDGRIFRAREL